MSVPPVIVVRPEPGNSATLTAAHRLGIAAQGFPLFEVAPVAWSCPAAGAFGGLLVGSANVFRHGGSDLARLKSLPVHVVGQTTADAATAAGFTVATIGEGGLQPVLDRLPGQRLLRLAGEDHIPLTPPSVTTIETRVVYAARALPLSDELAHQLRQPAVVLLHSGEAARHFAAECNRIGIDRQHVALACLAPRIAEMAGTGWNSIEISAERSDAALLALAGQMCQNTRFGGVG